MLRVLDSKQIQYGSAPAIYYEFAGRDDDDKPTEGVATGSTFLEVNTGDVYAYDETDESWAKICALGGSGS